MPWPDGYACDFRDPKFNVAQVPRVESYRGFVFASFATEGQPLKEFLGHISTSLDDMVDRAPDGEIELGGDRPPELGEALIEALQQPDFSAQRAVPGHDLHKRQRDR